MTTDTATDTTTQPKNGLDNAEARIREELARLGGRNLRDDDIIVEGRKLIIPEGTTKKDAVKILQRSIEAEDQPTSFHRQFQYRPWDGARSFNRVCNESFGILLQKKGGIFGMSPPALITITTGVNSTEQVPWGDVEIPVLPGVTITLDSAWDDDWGMLFSLRAVGPRKYRHEVEGLFTLVQRDLETGSMYRGKAIDGREQANFLDLSGVNPEHIIYADEVLTQLEANVWSLLRFSEQQVRYGLPLKRAILLEGPFGTGKTLAAFRTAQIAVENGWTFLYCRPATDEISTVMQTARLYQPAVVFFEDMDTVSNGTATQDEVTHLLDVFDGINAKGTRIMAVLTTNHPEKIHKGMLRPGRLDAVVHIGALDAHGVERMVRAEVPAEMLGRVDFAEVYKSMEGFMPAFCKEAIDRAKRYNIARNEGVLTMLDTEDFVQSARGLRPQLEMMDGNPEHKAPESLATAFGGVISDAAEVAVRRTVQERLLAPKA